MDILPIRAITDDVGALLQQSRDYQNSLYPPESVHQEDTDSLLSDHFCFLGAYQQSVLLGIGAVKQIHATPVYGEIKNLFIASKYRGLGAAKAIMVSLEAHLIHQKINLCRLETGPSQLASIGLYQRLGYRECGLYGDYKPDPFSVFMEKQLTTEMNQ